MASKKAVGVQKKHRVVNTQTRWNENVRRLADILVAHDICIAVDKDGMLGELK